MIDYIIISSIHQIKIKVLKYFGHIVKILKILKIL